MSFTTSLALAAVPFLTLDEAGCLLSRGRAAILVRNVTAQPSRGGRPGCAGRRGGPCGSC